MGRDDRFDRPGRQAMARDIDDVIDAANDVDKAIGVDQPRVSGGVITGMLARIGVLEMAVASPQRRQTTRRERQPQPDIAAFADGPFALFGIEDGKAIDRKSVVKGRSVSGRVDYGGRRVIKTKHKMTKD